jgi:uncharacterized protein YjiS (DUF1127 family)
MDARITKAEAALLLPSATPSSRRMAEVEAIRLAAMAARDAAIADALRRAARAAFRFLITLGRAVRAFPRRIETYRALQALSDRELRDIGMTRHDIGRVFEAGFAPHPANDAGKAPSPRAA